MTQLILGTALGFIVAQSGLYGIGHSLRWLQREEVRTRVRTMPGHVIVGGFIRYAAPIGAAAALLTLAVWAVGDYLAAKTARTAALASVLDSASAATGRQSPGADEPTGAGTAAAAETTTAV